MPNPASLLILLLAAVAGAAIYIALFAAFDAIERDARLDFTPPQRAANRIDTRVIAGFASLVLAGSVAQLAVGGVA